MICEGCGARFHPLVVTHEAFVVSAECLCGERVLAWRADGAFSFGSARSFLRRPSRDRLVTTAQDVLVLVVFVSMGGVLAAIALGEALRAIAFEGAVLARFLFLGGPVCVLISLAYIAWCFAGDTIARWLADRRVAYRDPPGGLRLVREPTTYRV